MLLGCSLELGEGSGQEQVEEGEQLDLRGRLAVVLEQENYLVGGVCQALLGPVPGEVELCLSPEGECSEHPVPDVSCWPSRRQEGVQKR